MPRYQYSLVRCVPEPRTGEYINIGAIAGSSDEGVWQVRQLQNLGRAAKICGAEELKAVNSFLAEVSSQFEQAEDSLIPIADNWLSEACADRRNIVQLSAPKLAVGANVNDVLDLICDRQLVDIERSSRQFVGKNTLLANLRQQVRQKVPAGLAMERPEVVVGKHLHARLDFAFGDKRAVQLTQAWSFQKGSVDDVATEVKAWGYALQRLRDGDTAFIRAKDRVVSVDQSVSVGVFLAEPVTDHQSDIFDEASDVFDALDVTVFSAEKGSESIGESIAKLLQAA